MILSMSGGVVPDPLPDPLPLPPPGMRSPRACHLFVENHLTYDTLYNVFMWKKQVKIY